MYSRARNVEATRTVILQKEAEIQQIDAQLAKLIEERKNEGRAIAMHKACKAPIKKVSAELLAVIFGYIHIGPLNGGDYHPPWSLGLVCSTWRKVALSMPELWCSLKLGAFLKPVPLVQVQTFLSRSANLPLSISSKELSCFSYNMENANEEDRLAVLGRFIERWRHLELQFHYVQPNLTFGKANPDERVAPLLEAFELESKYEMAIMGEMIEEQINTLIKNAPRLHAFSWSNKETYRQVPSCTLRLPWAQLSRLNLNRMLSFEEVFDILSRCSSLTSCTFDLIRLPSSTNIARHPISLRHLKSMSINTIYDPAPFFDSLLLPALGAIQVGFGERDVDRDYDDILPDWPQAAFISLMTRSSSPLEQLSLQLRISEDDVLACLRHASATVKVLDMRGVYDETRITDKFFEALTWGHSGHRYESPLCPLLQSIRLHLCCTKYSGKSVSEVAFKRMLESRRDSESGAQESTERGSSSSRGTLLPIHEILNIPGIKLFMEWCPYEERRFLPHQRGISYKDPGY